MSARRITPRTKAVIAVHFCGYPAAVAELRALCDEHGLVLIEDCAQAIGARVDEGGRSVGTVGELGAFSFFSKKQLCVGEGGMVSCWAGEHAERVRLLRSHALTSSTWDRHRGHDPAYDIVDIGFNYRMDEPRAALGLSRLQRLPDALGARRRTVGAYREQLAGIDGLELCFDDEAVARSSHFAFPVLVADRERARPLPRPAQRRRHPDDVVPGAAHLHRLRLLHARGRTARGHRGRRAPLRAAAQLEHDGRGDRDRGRGGAKRTGRIAGAERALALRAQATKCQSANFALTYAAHAAERSSTGRCRRGRS